MRRRSNSSLTVALCTSLAVHGLGLSALAWWFVEHAPPPRVAAADEAAVRRATLPPPRPPAPRPRRRPPPPSMPQDAHPLPKDDSGEADGHGTANRSTPGAGPMRAERGYEQADLMRSKVADPSLIDPGADRTAQAGRQSRDDALPLSPVAPQHGTYHPDFVAEADAAADPAGQVAPKAAPARALGPLPPSPLLALPAEAVAPPTPSGVRVAVAPSSPSVAPPPTARQVRGRLASASDTESPPFAKDATVGFHAGRMDGRQGMKVQMFAPRWGLASQEDLSAVGELHAVFGAHVRPDGSVAYVDVLQTSGSPNVDLDCERAVYAGTFEPRKDKLGHPMATLWTIVYD